MICYNNNESKVLDAQIIPWEKFLLPKSIEDKYEEDELFLVSIPKLLPLLASVKKFKYLKTHKSIQNELIGKSEWSKTANKRRIGM
jgi:hypothetical protein